MKMHNKLITLIVIIALVLCAGALWADDTNASSTPGTPAITTSADVAQTSQDMGAGSASTNATTQVALNPPVVTGSFTSAVTAATDSDSSSDTTDSAAFDTAFARCC
ncbi:MAG: hypothetical protein ABFD54_05965 [Armatimonadota bacterium]|nr:hypothetical protein [bacterium]